MSRLFEADGYFLVDIVLLITLIAFNLQIGIIYISMVVFDWMIYYYASDQKIYSPIPLERNQKDRLFNLITSVGVFVAFYFAVAYLSMSVFAVATKGSYLSNLGQIIAQTFSATPILYGSDYLKLVVWGILIPVVETRFFFRTLMQWGTTTFAKTSLPTSIFSFKAVWVSSFWGMLFMIFHIAAKGITDNKALFITFLFGFASVMCVIYFKEAIQAIILHILWNTVGTMYQLNIGFAESVGSGLIITSSLILISWALMFQQIPFVTKNGVGI